MSVALSDNKHIHTYFKLTLIVALLTVLFFFARLVPYIDKPTAGFMSYYTAGKLLLDGYDMTILYDQKQFHDIIPVVTQSPVEDDYRANPPTISILFLPFAFFIAAKAKLLWEFFSLACIILSLMMVRKHFSMTPLQFLLAGALTFSFSPLYINFVYGQMYAFLFMLHVALLISWKSGNKLTSSLLIACMLSLKGYGVIFLILAVIFKEWRLILYTIFCYGLIVLASSLILGLNTWLLYFEKLSDLITNSAPAVTYQQNLQSFLGFMNEKFFNNLLSPNIQIVILALMFGGLIWMLISMNRRSGALEYLYSASIIIGVITAPQLFDYHYSLLIIPVIAVFLNLSSSLKITDLVMFGLALLLLSAKIPYHYSIFQNTLLGIFGFPRIYGGVIMIWLLYKSTMIYQNSATRNFIKVSNAPSHTS